MDDTGNLVTQAREGVGPFKIIIPLLLMGLIAVFIFALKVQTEELIKVTEINAKYDELKETCPCLKGTKFEPGNFSGSYAFEVCDGNFTGNATDLDFWKLWRNQYG
jgi:hypothetical protein